jgi:hypothetical protein
MAHQGVGNEPGQMTSRHVLTCATLLAAVSVAASPGSIASYTATSANVSGAPDEIRIELLRWSTDAERDKLMDAWNLKTGNANNGGGAGRGGAGRGGPARGGSARGGRGGGEGEAAANTAAAPSPEAALATALQQATTVGYLWSREVAGYAIRYAGKIATAGGSERIVLITQRRLGAVNDLWRPAGADPLPYDFSIIELRVNANGDGEGKASLNGRVAPDASLKIVALENYDALPVVFSHVQRRPGSQ